MRRDHLGQNHRRQEPGDAGKQKAPPRLSPPSSERLSKAGGKSRRILVASRQSVLPGNGGSQAFTASLLTYLADAGFDIRVVMTDRTYGGRRAIIRLPPMFVGKIDLHVPRFAQIGSHLINPRALLREMISPCLALAGRGLRLLPGPLGRFGDHLYKAHTPVPATTEPPKRIWRSEPADEVERALVLRHIDQFQPDVLLANYVWMADAFPPARHGRFRVLLTHDVWFRKMESFRQAKVEAGLQPMGRAEERRLLERADLLLAITEEDERGFRELVPHAEIMVVSMAVAPQAAPGGELPARCLFVGSAYAANVSGLRWFLERCWPAIVGTVPHATLHVCGRVCEHFTEVPPGVVLRGLVDSLAPEYAAASAVVVPLLAGSGLKIKLVEALSHGKACVSTPVGMQGVEFLESVAVCEKPDAFAGAVVELLADDDHRRAMEAAALEEVRRHFSPPAVYGPVAARLEIGATPVAEREPMDIPCPAR